jgi:tRNA dimethylallyltransferase
MRLALATSLATLRRCVAMSAAPKTKVVVLAGPTAVGKSAAALELCRSLGGEIVSADSVQLYRGLDIGANKPSAAERAAVRHHLVDAGDPAAPWSAGEWCRAAVAAVDDVAARGGVPVVVGGTMMYARWLVRGAPDAPPASAASAAAAAALLAPHEAAGDWAGAVAAVAAEGETFAARAAALSANDWYRLARAVEIELDGGAGGAPPLAAYDARCAFLAPGDRAALFHGIDARCDAMLARGLLGEVAALRAAGRLPETSTAARAIGYRQALDYLVCRRDDAGDGALGAGARRDAYVDFCRKFRTASRNYAAEQMKWYRRDGDFAVVPAGDGAALAALVAGDRADYEARRAGDGAARDSLAADKKVMKTFASRPCAAAADPAALASHLAAADAAVAVLRAAGGRGDGARDDDTVRLAALKRQKRGGEAA